MYFIFCGAVYLRKPKTLVLSLTLILLNKYGAPKTIKLKAIYKVFENQAINIVNIGCNLAS